MLELFRSAAERPAHNFGEDQDPSPSSTGLRSWRPASGSGRAFSRRAWTPWPAPKPRGRGRPGPAARPGPFRGSLSSGSACPCAVPAGGCRYYRPPEPRPLAQRRIRRRHRCGAAPSPLGPAVADGRQDRRRCHRTPPLCRRRRRPDRPEPLAGAGVWSIGLAGESGHCSTPSRSATAPSPSSSGAKKRAWRPWWSSAATPSPLSPDAARCRPSTSAPRVRWPVSRWPVSGPFRRFHARQGTTRHIREVRWQTEAHVLRVGTGRGARCPLTAERWGRTWRQAFAVTMTTRATSASSWPLRGEAADLLSRLPWLGSAVLPPTA